MYYPGPGYAYYEPNSRHEDPQLDKNLAPLRHISGVAIEEFSRDNRGYRRSTGSPPDLKLFVRMTDPSLTPLTYYFGQRSRRVLRACREAQKRGALTPLEPYLRHPDSGVRGMAAGALACVGGFAARTRLQEMLSDTEEDVRQVATAALIELGVSTDELDNRPGRGETTEGDDAKARQDSPVTPAAPVEP